MSRIANYRKISGLLAIKAGKMEGQKVKECRGSAPHFSLKQKNSDVKKPRTSVRGFFTYIMPGSSLLSHGEAPHYHRRYGVSLLSSAWGQVGPPRYSRQANSWCTERIFYVMTALPSLSHTGHIPQYAPADVLALRLVTPQNLSFPQIL